MGCQPSVPRAGSPRHIFVHRAASPGYRNVPRAASPRYKNVLGLPALGSKGLQIFVCNFLVIGTVTCSEKQVKMLLSCLFVQNFEY